MPVPAFEAFDPASDGWPPLAGGGLHLWLLPHKRGERSMSALQSVIARYLRVEPGLVQLLRSDAGRPLLASPASDLQFSASHSGAALLLGFAIGDCIGVDIECRKPRLHALELARRFFSAHEALALAGMTQNEREDAFYRLWTAKEALLKAIGRGLAHGLDRVEFEFVGDQLALRALDVAPALSHAGERIAIAPITAWQLLECTPLPGYRASILYTGAVRDVHAWRIG